MSKILLNCKEKEMILALICEEQIRMIMKNPKSYMNANYTELESLKVKTNNLEMEEI